MLKILEKPDNELTPQEFETKADIKRRITPTEQQVATQMPAKLQLAGVELARKIQFTKDFLRECNSYRGQVNYEYWEMRAKAEQREDMVEARRLMFEADQLLNVADVKGALESYEKAWIRWGVVFSLFPAMISEEVGDDVVKSLGRYRRLAENELDETFILHEFLEYRNAKDTGLSLNVGEKLEKMSARAQALLAAENAPTSEATPPKGSQEASKVESPAKSIVPEVVKETEPVKESEPVKAVEPPKVESVKSVDPTKTLEPIKVDEPKAEIKKEESLVRPPTLENPDSQD